MEHTFEFSCLKSNDTDDFQVTVVRCKKCLAVGIYTGDKAGPIYLRGESTCKVV